LRAGAARSPGLQGEWRMEETPAVAAVVAQEEVTGDAVSASSDDASGSARGDLGDAGAEAPDVVLPARSSSPGNGTTAPGSAGSAGKETPLAVSDDEAGDGHVRSHVEQVAELMRQASGAQDKLEKFYSSRGLACRMPEHVESVYIASGITDYEGRARLVQKAIEKQQQMLLERKSKKKLRDKLRDAAGLAATGDGREASAGGASSSALPPLVGCDSLDTMSPYGMEQPLESGWSKVRDFKTMEEAMHFVMECQPIDYRPLGCYLGPEGFPKFESRANSPLGRAQKAFQYVMNMDPLPQEFVSVEGKFRRRVRVRKLDEEELRESRSGPAAVQRKRKTVGGLRGARGARLLETVLAAKELKAFVVEVAGELFDRPPSLRCLNNHAANTRFFIAVSPEIEKKVLVEGYRVKRRCSIPCSATPKEAREAFRRETSEKQAGRPTSPRISVLAVSLPPELGIDVVAHKAGGFLIRTKELPAGCFSRLRRVGAGGEPS